MYRRNRNWVPNSRMASRRDLQNVLRGQAAPTQSPHLEFCRTSRRRREVFGERRRPVVRLQIAETESQALPDGMLHGLSDAERQVLELMRRRECWTAVFAAALGITALPIAEQRRQVKRIKDRLSSASRRGERHQ